jgi:PKD repeat protein
MNSTGVIVEHAYFDDGNYTVVLMVTDDDGATDSTSAVKTVLNRSPVALFTESAEIVLTGEVILFNASDSYDPDGSITSYFWDFGDGANASGVIVEHAYPDNGNYTVTLILMDNNGATDTATATKTVLNRSPVALFTESAETAYVNETIMFNASGSYDSDGYIASYFWDFGDGANASGVIVEHAYSTNGTFVVTLTVTDDDNALDSAQATKTIIAQEFIHDVAVLDVTPSANEVYNRRSINVTIVVMNKGTATETFNVTLYSAPIQGWHIIGAGASHVWYSDGKDLGDFLLLASVTVPTGNPVLTFDTKYRIEHLYDYGFVQVSRDGGITWHSLANTYTTYKHALDADPDIITNLPGLTGTSEGWPGWTTMTFNLTDYAGETIMLGFRYMTDWATTEEGWYIDNIRISGNVIPNQFFEQADPPPLTAIQTQTIINLTPGSSTTITFTWNTTNTSVGRFSISATAKTVVGETETNDNTCLDGVVEVKCNPDINGDGVVNLFDLTILGTAWDSRPGDPNWNEWADLDGDGHIFLYDLTMLGSHWDELIP